MAVCDLVDVRKARMFRRSLSPDQYSHVPAAIAASAAANCSAAIGRPALDVWRDPSDDPSGVGRRACRRTEDDSNDKSRPSLKCERMLRSSIQKSRAVLPVFSTAAMVGGYCRGGLHPEMECVWVSARVPAADVTFSARVTMLIFVRSRVTGILS